MLEFLRGSASDRKLRLFALACFALTPAGWVTTADWDLFDSFVRYLDKELSADDWLDIFSAAHGRGIRNELFSVFGPDPMHAAETALWHGGYQTGAGHNEHKHRLARILQVRPLRAIFGNPFRPVAFDPRWRTADAVGLARGIYDERAFDRLPLLADALMDTGCADEQMLEHCRSEGPHVRGCWVVDLVLGKE
jgi:hypothetical protein